MKYTKEEVIEYIKQVRELQKTLSSQLNAKDQEIAKLNSRIKEIEVQSKQIEEKLKDLENEGYSNFKAYKETK